LPNERKYLPKPEALEFYKKSKQIFKCELVEEKVTEPMVSFYSTGTIYRFLPRPAHSVHQRIQAFKLMSVAGAYWKGQEGNPQLQRILRRRFLPRRNSTHICTVLEEGKRPITAARPELDLFSIQEEAGPGLIFWHPKGGFIRNIIENWLRDELINAATIWSIRRTSCAWISGKLPVTQDFYRENMFGPVEVEKAEYQLKPMNCPGHILIYKSRLRSYRDLPVRLAELGTVYRYERSGVPPRLAARPRFHPG